MLSERYTETQVLCGLHDAWETITGANDSFDADTQIDTFMKADGTWDEIDFADIFRDLEQFFGFHCTDDEWTAFFGFEIAKRSLEEWDQVVAPKLTFRALANFIADRAPVVASFTPQTIFGCYCAPAGVFNGIQRLLVAPEIAPSTRIIHVLRGNTLDGFWTKLHWMSEHSIPPLPTAWRRITCRASYIGVVLVLLSLSAYWITSKFAYVALAIFAAAFLYAAASIYKQQSNPLPPNIVTFRDLSTAIAKSGKWDGTLFHMADLRRKSR